MDGGLKKSLLPGERVLWTGVPAQGLRFTGWDWLAIPASLLLTALPVGWEILSLFRPAGSAAMRWLGVPLLVVVLLVGFGRFFLDAWLRRRISYAVTDRRVLIHRRGLLGGLRELYLGEEPYMTLVDRPDGTGTIWFDMRAPRWWEAMELVPALDRVPAFIGIAGARHVFELIGLAVQLRLRKVRQSTSRGAPDADQYLPPLEEVERHLVVERQDRALPGSRLPPARTIRR